MVGAPRYDVGTDTAAAVDLSAHYFLSNFAKDHFPSKEQNSCFWSTRGAHRSLVCSMVASYGTASWRSGWLEIHPKPTGKILRRRGNDLSIDFSVFDP